jgi:hypothetical protein
VILSLTQLYRYTPFADYSCPIRLRGAR